MKSNRLPAGLLLLAVATGCGGGPGGTTGPVGTQLVITQQPSDGVANRALTPVFTVEVRDANDELVTGATTNVKIHLNSVNAQPHLVGTNSRRAVQGVATFPGLSIDSAGSYTIIAVATGMDSATGVAIGIEPPSPPPTTAEVIVGTDEGGIQFRSTRNGTINPAVDTIVVHGTVTWTWQNGPHSVHSTGTASFTSSDTSSVVNHEFPVTFNTTGTYNYNCSVHTVAMTGRVVVK